MKKNCKISKKCFRERLKSLQLTLTQFADYVGYTEQSVRKWEDDTIPLWVEPVLRYLELGIVFSASRKKR